MNPAKTVLLTGASSGIGYEFVRIFAAEHYDLVLVARDRRRLEDAAREAQTQYGVTATVIAKDLAEAHAPEEIFEELRRLGIRPSVLVNNAGFGDYGLFSSMDPAKIMGMIQVNMSALVSLTHLFLAQVPAQGGKILNVASTAAFQPGPLMAVYYATKAFVLSFSEALREELRTANVSVTVLCPGPTATDFQRRANVIGMRMLKYSMMDARTVARIGYEGLMRGRSIVIPGFGNRVLAFLVRFSPRAWVGRVVYFIQKKTKHSPASHQP